MKRHIISVVFISVATLLSLVAFFYCLWCTIAWIITTKSYIDNPEKLGFASKSVIDSFISSCYRSIAHNAVFAIGFLLMSACLIFLILRKNKVQLSYAIRYSREKRTERRFARRAERQERKRKALEEKLSKME